MSRKDLMNAVEAMVNITLSGYEGNKEITPFIEIMKKVLDYKNKNRLMINQMFFGTEEVNNVTGTYVILTINNEKVVRIFRVFKENSFNGFDYENLILARQERM